MAAPQARTSRMFLQAWTLLLLDPENKGRGQKTGGSSDHRLVSEIVSHHQQLYPSQPISRHEVKRFLKKERERSTGITQGNARDNYVRWENVTEELRLLRSSIVGKLAGNNNHGLHSRQQELEDEEHNDLFGILGLR